MSMFELLLQLIILFLVIFDPLASFAVFYVATKHMKDKERRKIAALSITVALGISLLFLLFGNIILTLFHTTLDEFRVAGGIVLGILGIKMALGHPLMNLEQHKKKTGAAIAAIIGTPLLTGPAAITAILISTQDYGIVLTGTSILIVLFTTGIIFYFAKWMTRYISTTAIQIMSTVLGLITIAWAVRFIRVGL